ncbi:MAG: tripartite tricarboxylate transporter substrate binding protein [Betaproteobacteria bacterium]|nr:tripartite tricarboxylate transporter substrate binding protein [Betaproteobacteria bacterium]
MLVAGSVVLTISMGILVAGSVTGQTYPDRSIRVIAASAGGGADYGVRLIVPGLSVRLGQQVVVDNRGVTAIEVAAKAAPDGYTLLYYGSTVWLMPLMQDVPYDPVRDLAPIILVNGQPNILIVHPSLPVKSVQELIALAKAKGGNLNYASGPAGASNQMAGELFKAMAEVNIVGVPYKGTGPATVAVLTGEVHLSFLTPGAVAPHLKSGRLRALAVTSEQRSALVPDLPTVAASGVPGYESVVLAGMFAPARTSTAIINRLSQEIGRVISSADVKEKFLGSGAEIIGGTPEQFAAKIKSEIIRMGKVIKDAGIRAD